MQYTRKDIVKELGGYIDQTPGVDKSTLPAITEFLLDKIVELHNEIDDLRTEMYDRYDRK